MFTFELEGISNELISEPGDHNSEELNYRQTHKSFMFLDGIADKPLEEKHKFREFIKS